MNFMQVVIEAFRSMSANRLRSLLTMLGIVIGDYLGGVAVGGGR